MFRIFLVFLFAVSSVQAEPITSHPVVDLHCHTAGVGAGNSGNFISPAIQDSWKFGIYLKSFGTNKDEIKAKGDAIVIEKIAQQIRESQYVDAAVILALDGMVNVQGELDRDKTEIYVDNDFVAREVKKYPQLYFGASINPLRKDAIERLAKVKAQGAVLMKWLPPMQGFSPADLRLIPFYQKLKDYNLPLLVHTGNERSFTHSDDTLGDPMLLRMPLSIGVKVIAAHAGTTGKNQGEDNVERLAKLMSEFPNLYAEISTINNLNKRFFAKRVIQEKRFQGRMVYGSDFPLINSALVSPWYYPFSISPKKIWQIWGVENPWDQDFLIKRALGVKMDTFLRGGEVVLFSQGEKDGKTHP